MGRVNVDGNKESEGSEGQREDEKRAPWKMQENGTTDILSHLSTIATPIFNPDRIFQFTTIARTPFIRASPSGHDKILLSVCTGALLLGAAVGTFGNDCDDAPSSVGGFLAMSVPRWK